MTHEQVVAILEMAGYVEDPRIGFLLYQIVDIWLQDMLKLSDEGE